MKSKLPNNIDSDGSISNLARFLGFALTIIFTVFMTASGIQAFEARSTNYKMQMGNFNYTAGEKESASYWFHDTGGELAPGQSDSGSYTILAGFEYIASIIPFTFEISNNNINFGTLVPETPATASTTLTITSGAAYGYRVTAQANNPMQNQGYAGVFIPDVEGDNSDITHLQEGAWNNNTTYGFGYTLSNLTSTHAVFTSGYRAFADQSNSEEPVNVMFSPGVIDQSAVEVTYKINVSPIQEAGVYENIVTYIATGTY